MGLIQNVFCFFQAALAEEKKKKAASGNMVKTEGDEVPSTAKPRVTPSQVPKQNGNCLKLKPPSGGGGVPDPIQGAESGAVVMNGDNRKQSVPNGGGEIKFRLSPEDAKLREALREDTALQIWANRERRMKAVIEPQKKQGAVLPAHGWKRTPHEVALGEWADARKCVFCRETGEDELSGRLLVFDDGGWAHCNCALWSSEVYDMEGILQGAVEARKRSRSLKCAYCHVGGATVGCCHRGCKANYHFMCALAKGSAFFEDKRVYCNQHKHYGVEQCQVSIKSIKSRSSIHAARPVNDVIRYVSWV